jgi:HAD superfamily hydrolase (TIGR01509 family)
MSAGVLSRWSVGSKHPMTVTAALFDVDGTLVDTNYLHAVAWWEAFAYSGHDVPMAAIHHVIGMGSDQLLDALLPGDRDRDADDGIRTAHSAMYSAYWSRIRPLPQAAELLRACRKAGLRVVLASSADPQEFEVLRAALDAEDAIDETTSSGDVDTSKPAPDLVRVALDKAGVPPEQAVFVGDTVWDVEACQRAGVPCLGLRSGGISRAELVDAGAVAVFADPAELLATTAGRLAEALPGRPDN